MGFYGDSLIEIVAHKHSSHFGTQRPSILVEQSLAKVCRLLADDEETADAVTPVGGGLKISYFLMGFFRWFPSFKMMLQLF